MTTSKFDRHACRAADHLSAIARQFPNAWSQVDMLRGDRSDIDWPDWCFLPLGGWYAIVSSAIGRPQVPITHIQYVAQLGALGAWRMTKGVYRFDPTLYQDLVQTPVAGDIPHEILYQMPEWCVYIETPGLSAFGDRLHGFFAHLEHDANDGRAELRLLLDTDKSLLALPIHLGAWPLAESVLRAVETASRQFAVPGLATSDVSELMAETAHPLISLLLYLCTQSDYSRRGQPGTPSNPEPKRTRRHGWKMFPATGPIEWDVGVRMGAALRAAYHAAETQQTDAAGSHASPRAHIRRAHWHTFVSGPRKTEGGTEIPADQRKRATRWMPPIPVNLGDIDTLPAVIRPTR